MKVILNLSLVFFLFNSCSQKNLTKEEEVINDIFLELIGLDYYIKQPSPPPYAPIHPDSLLDIDKEFNQIYTSVEDDSLRREMLEEYSEFDWEKYRQEYQKWKRELENPPLEKNPLVVFMEDTLKPITESDYLYERLKKFLNKGFKDELINNLIYSLNEPIPLDLDKIKNTGRYILYPESGKPKLENYIDIGAVRFSRISFSDDYKEGFFTMSFYCGGECGHGEVILISKLNNKWVINKRSMMWVA